MSDVKLVKVDNWGIYFLQRLKHFFNRTDYCDLTLQFQNNAQLKVHRLVLSACTEYFELLERTCEMYEDCLVMPDDLQADVVVPIVNFMYTGQLEFKLDLLESLYQTSQIMNMHVLTKLLDAHRRPVIPKQLPKRSYTKPASTSSSNISLPHKRVYSQNTLQQPEKKQVSSSFKTTSIVKEIPIATEIPTVSAPKRQCIEDPRPSRYELPEELADNNIFDSSFTNISYTSEPLMVHPETTKKYPARKSGIFRENVGSSRIGETSTLDIVECTKVSSPNEHLFDDDLKDRSLSHETEMFTNLSDSSDNSNKHTVQITNQLFDQILDQPEGPKITIETKDNLQVNVDHAKIISEVLKKYPHLVKSNKNIKLKILNTPNSKKKGVLSQTPMKVQQQIQKIKNEEPDYVFESDVLDSKEAARLIALGADNIKGPWICLICGAPGKALHFKTYYKFRCHLVNVHNEKPISKMCEYCGLKSFKRNYLLHHLYTKHGVPPPPSYNFPKCNQCNYVALTEGYLIKHKLSHSESVNFRCNVCSASYSSSQALLKHIQATNHKYSSEKRKEVQCIYCLKIFLRHRNLFTHLKACHKDIAKNDEILEESDEEQPDQFVKSEPVYEEEEAQYQIEQKPDGNIHIVTKKDRSALSVQKTQKILNSGYVPVKKVAQIIKPTEVVLNAEFEFNQTANLSANKNEHEEIVMINNSEYIMKDNQLIPRENLTSKNEYIISDLPGESETMEPATSLSYSCVQETLPQQDNKEKVDLRGTSNINQLQIVVSNEEEYKALMNSNHSIIFDDSDTNKTLTVLSTPHTTEINSTAIELDNSPSNNMMVIPENYQLNVSEAIPTDNNIVVVYSHPVTDKDKQYQLITSQEMKEQFVQTSVLTPNYEPIPTSTAVLSAHVIDANVTVSWQNEPTENISPVQETELQEKHNSELKNIPTGEVITDINNAFTDLPEVTLTQSKPIDDSESMEVNDEIATDIENPTDQNIQPQPATTMDVDISASELTTNIETHYTDETVSTENVNVEPNVDESCIVEEGIPVESDTNVIQHIHESCIVEEGIEVQAEEPDGRIEEQDELVTEDINTEQGEVINISEHNDEAIQTKPSNEMPPQTKEQIESLASEWSDDEIEASGVNKKHDVSLKSNDNSLVNVIPKEVEESIENIQQEMEKQMMEATVTTTEIESSNKQTIQVNSVENLEEKKQCTDGSQKISSLLNDWDDNDSQEEKADTEILQPAETTNNDSLNSNKEIPNVGSEIQELCKKDDKIKSLVSDWDEEDDTTTKDE